MSAPVHGSDVARCWAGFASFGAGLVHIAVVREHLDVSVSHGVFFAAVGLAQIGWALWALGATTVPRPRSTVFVTVALIALWALSRTVGLPLGLGGKEPVGTADVLAVVLQVGLILTVALAARSAAAQRHGPELTTGPALASVRFVSLLAAGALAVSALATPAMAATMAGDHAHPHGGSGHSEPPSSGGSPSESPTDGGSHDDEHLEDGHGH